MSGDTNKNFMQEIQITSIAVEEIRELVESGNTRVLDELSPSGISLPAAISLCLSLDLWVSNKTLDVSLAQQLINDLPLLSDAEINFSQHPNASNDKGALFDSRETEFFSIRSESHFPSLDWDNFCQRFKKGLTENGFSTDYASALALAFHEMADNVIQHSQVGIQNSSYSGLAGYHVASNYMSFSVGDNGIGALASLKTNPKYSALSTSEDALMAIYSKQATRREHQEYGGGFQQVFKSLLDLNSFVKIRSGDVLVDYYGVSARTIDLQNMALKNGLEMSVTFRLDGNMAEIIL